MIKEPPLPNDDSYNDLNDALERFDELLNRGIDKIYKIETDEFVKGMSAEDLGQKIGADGSLTFERSQFSMARKTGGLCFQEDIQYLIANQHESIENISFDDLDLLKDVNSSQLIATCQLDENKPGLFDEMMAKYNKEYQEKAGISVSQKDDQLAFYATRKGKVLIVGNMLTIVAADRDGTCTVHLSEDGMEATVDCSVSRGNGKKLTFSLILLKLEQAGVLRGIDRPALEETMEKIKTEGKSSMGIVAAKGQPPINGKDATVTIHPMMTNEEIGFKILPDGRIDYKKQAPIRMVKIGELLATVTEPEKGVDGFTVTGKILPAKDGEADVLFEGENVHKDQKDNKYYADCAGMVSFHEKVLSVFPMYQVNGDVDLKSGNINFNGSVTILGNVRSGFEVKASGDIFITGSAEAATIDAGRDIRINGAVVGGGKTVVRAGRNIFAGHVQNALLEAQGDITIVRSVMHSTIYSTGKLVLHDRDGSIIGGTVNAMRGLEVMSIGSPVGTHTEIIVGSDFLIQKKKKELQEIAEYYKMNIAKIDTVLRPLMDFIKKGVPLGTEKKQRLTTIIDKRKNTDKQLRLLQFRINELSEIDPASSEAAIVVQKIIYQDVVLKIATAVLITNDEIHGAKCFLSADRKHIEMKRLNLVNF